MLNVRIKKGKNIMLKEKQYSMEELKVVFQCNNRQQLKNKLTNYGVLFDDIDRGDQCIFDIKQITNITDTNFKTLSYNPNVMIHLLTSRHIKL